MQNNETPWRFGTGTHKQFEFEYIAEISKLADVVARADFNEILSYCTNYDKHIQSSSDTAAVLSGLRARSHDIPCIDVTAEDSVISKSMAIGHFAACCHLLHGSKLPISSLQPATLMALADQFVKSCEVQPESYRRRLVNKFHIMDVMRIIHFLRSLGLVTKPSNEIFQLGIGAADGTRDVLSIHLAPKVEISVENGKKFVALSAEKNTAAETIIIDSDPQYRNHYAELNRDDSLNVLAINADTMDALKTLPSNLSHKRNMITGLRIDHRMLPNVEDFFRYLAPCIDTSCDLILTIGAGDTPSDFSGRIKKFGDIYQALASSGFEPLLFRLHGEGSIEEQQKSLYFGNVRASSYQILYCRLSNNELAARF